MPAMQPRLPHYSPTRPRRRRILHAPLASGPRTIADSAINYLEVRCLSGLTVSQGTLAVAAKLHTALPPSLLCLSLTLPSWVITRGFLSPLRAQCPHLTHCHVYGVIGYDLEGDGSDLEDDEDEDEVWKRCL